MKRRKQKSIFLASILILIFGLTTFFLIRNDHKQTPIELPKNAVIAPTPTPKHPEPIKPRNKPLPKPEPVKKVQQYYMYTMKTNDTEKELSALVGTENILSVLQTNRIDLDHIKSGTKIVIPKTFGLSNRSPFPIELEAASGIEKLLVINQRIQAFGAYESGKLVRWGPTSTGKESTKTANGLFSTNWKGEEIKSSFDDEWILKYNFNFDNFQGIGFHQYTMPGYPASHSCVRLLLEDAMWLYDWADQWVLSPNERSRLAHGTPVLIFGDYAYGEISPWKLLPTDPNATKVDEEELTQIITANEDTIISWQNERATVLKSREE